MDVSQRNPSLLYTLSILATAALHYDIKWKQHPAESLCLAVWCSLASLAPDKIPSLPGHINKMFEATGPLNPTTIRSELWLHLGHFWKRITDGQTTKPLESEGASIHKAYLL